MTIQSQIEALEKLATLDAELAIVEEELGRENANIRQKKDRLEELTARLNASRASAGDMERTRSDLMVEIRQMAMQVERSREKMARCRTEKESLAVQRELEELRRLVRDREIEVEKFAQLIDVARGEIATGEAEQSQLEGEIGSSEGPVREHCEGLETRRSALRAERGSIIALIKPPTLSRYEMIRKRRGTAVAHTSDGTCSACHIALPPMQFQLLMRREQLAQCPQCNRLLYFRSPSASGDASSGVPE